LNDSTVLSGQLTLTPKEINMKLLIPLILFINCYAIALPISSRDVVSEKKKAMLKSLIMQELKMDVHKMKRLLKNNTIDFKHKNNAISFQLQGFNFIIIYDEKADRMRIVCPVAEIKDVTSEQLKLAMEANFHTALDARYALSNEIVWSVFIHPLSDLSEDLFISAIEQVLYAAATFGKEYSSGAFSFPKANEDENKKVEKIKGK
jgi:hypothetical protein